MNKNSNCSRTSTAWAFRAMSLLVPAIGMLWGAQPAAAEHLPTPTDCQDDIQGADDETGQGDLTQFCVAVGEDPYELHTKWNWDDTTIPGGNTADGCTLYDTDSDGNADLAICVTVGNAGGGDTTMILEETRLFTCDDANADKCTGSTQINVCTGGDTCLADADCPGGETCALQFGTQCEVTQSSGRF